MQDSGSSAGTAHHVHRTIRVALGEAVRRGRVPTNAAEIAKAPRLEEEDIEPYTIEEVRSLLVEAAKLRNSARWVVALALGCTGRTSTLRDTSAFARTAAQGVKVVRTVACCAAAKDEAQTSRRLGPLPK
ncbi:hypothetical protein ACZ91_34160 [Streptomyces regensis]|nr:hypothetical protein ACZ91_34160 [Streptomyces regensis]